MKTKIIVIIVITLIGIGFLTAFKQSEGSKKYLTMTSIGSYLYLINENGELIEKKTANMDSAVKNFSIDLNKEINAISSKGYKLINAFNYNSTGGTSIVLHIFEKE